MGMKGARRGTLETVLNLIGHSMGGLVNQESLHARKARRSVQVLAENASTQFYFLRQPIEVLTRPSC